MYHIAIIGAGQLGSRHLQGLKLAHLPMRIQIVDSSPASLNTAQERYEQIEPNPQIFSVECLTSIDNLMPELDLVIIATGSKPRAAILAELLAKKSVKNLVLEKILFPSIREYTDIETLLQAKGLLDRTWVNCPRRMFNGYKKLRDELTGVKKITYKKTGPNWGLGCNALHYIDHYAYLTGDTSVEAFDLSGLDPDMYDSKRPGYVEFTGSISGHTRKGGIIHITSSAQPGTADTLSIMTDGVLYDLDETQDQIFKDGLPWAAIGMKYQSGLTGTVAEQILLSDLCELTPYTESAALHLSLLRPLVAFYNNLAGKNSDNCPIT